MPVSESNKSPRDIKCDSHKDFSVRDELEKRPMQ